MANPFEINLLGGVNPGALIAGLGADYRQGQDRIAMQQQDAQVKELTARAAAGDMDAINQLMSINPQLAMGLEQRGIDAANRDKEAMKQRTTEALVGIYALPPEQRQAAFMKAVDDPSLDIDEEDYPIISNENLFKAQLNKMLGGDWSKYAFAQQEVKAPEVNAEMFKAYTPASIQQYRQTGDYSVLQEKGLSPRERVEANRQQKKYGLEVKKNELEIKKREREEQAAKSQASATRDMQVREAENTLNSLKAIYDPASGDMSTLESIYGSWEVAYPDILRSQKGIDAQKMRDQIVSLLQLEAAKKVQGQGSLSESERKTLADSATVLGNESISPELAKAEIEKLYPVFEKILQSNKSEVYSRYGL